MRNHAEANYEWFRKRLPGFLTAHRGEHALLHERDVADFYQSSLDAIKAGIKRFGEGNFSVEPVDDTIEDLGFYSHVSTTLRA